MWPPKLFIFYLGTNAFEKDASFIEHPCGEAILLSQQTQQQVFNSDVLFGETFSLLGSKRRNFGYTTAVLSETRPLHELQALVCRTTPVPTHPAVRVLPYDQQLLIAQHADLDLPIYRQAKAEYVQLKEIGNLTR